MRLVVAVFCVASIGAVLHKQGHTNGLAPAFGWGFELSADDLDVPRSYGFDNIHAPL